MKNRMPLRSRVLALLLAAVICACGGWSALAAETSDTPFTDVPDTAWYAEAVSFCYDLRLLAGVTPTQFMPSAPLTRGMLASVLWKMDGSPKPISQEDYADNLNVARWFYQPVNWAAENHIAAGYVDHSFGVNDPITRQQMAVFLYNYAVHLNPELGADPTPERDQLRGATGFADEDEISDYALRAVIWAREERILSGRPGNRFDPRGQSTRAEAAALIRNFLLPFDRRSAPTVEPEPTAEPSPAPSGEPSPEPSEEPSPVPSEEPSPSPSQEPTPIPSEEPTPSPSATPPTPTPVLSPTPEGGRPFTVRVAGKTFNGVLENSASGRALLEQMPFSVYMNERMNREKVYDLPVVLPTDPSTPQEIHAGDLLLYRNNGLRLFYADCPAYYPYTVLGRVTDPDGLAEALRGNSVKVWFLPAE